MRVSAGGTQVTVVAQRASDAALAAEIAERCALTADDPDARFALAVGPAAWQLADRTSRQRPLELDFSEYYRRRGVATARSPLGRATGIRQGQPATVLDCTAGLGRDGFMLASLGAVRVDMVERHPVLAAMLDEALQRAQRDPDLPAWVHALNVRCADARAVLGQPVSADVIYIDPMFPAERRALAGRELQFLQRLLAPEQDGDELVRAALASGSRRVVIKRAKHHPTLETPTFTVRGKSFRFDVYVKAG